MTLLTPITSADFLFLALALNPVLFFILTKKLFGFCTSNIFYERVDSFSDYETMMHVFISSNIQMSDAVATWDHSKVHTSCNKLIVCKCKTKFMSTVRTRKFNLKKIHHRHHFKSMLIPILHVSIKIIRFVNCFWHLQRSNHGFLRRQAIAWEFHELDIKFWEFICKIGIETENTFETENKFHDGTDQFENPMTLLRTFFSPETKTQSYVMKTYCSSPIWKRTRNSPEERKTHIHTQIGELIHVEPQELDVKIVGGKRSNANVKHGNSQK